MKIICILSYSNCDLKRIYHNKHEFKYYFINILIFILLQLYHVGYREKIPSDGCEELFICSFEDNV